MNPTTQIAENHIHISRRLFDEGMKAAENKDYKKSVTRIAVILAALLTALAAWLLYTGSSLIFLLGELIFLGALMFWLAVMLPGTKQRSKYKSMTCGTGGIPKRTVRFYPERLSVTADSGKETILIYDDISGWQETKNLYILNCKNNLHVLLDKNGFTVGNFDTVKELLKQAAKQN